VSLPEPLPPDPPLVDAKVLRKVCGQFATGVTVITSGLGGDAAGTTVNSFTSVSLQPPLVLFCLHHESRLLQGIRGCNRFAVNFLARPQEGVAWAFAGSQTAVLRDVPHHESTFGLPVLSGALAFLDCRVVRELDGGDHSILLGEVEEAVVLGHTRQPLIFFRGLMGALVDEPGIRPIFDG
jgi:3-hydroxy-9,10-secoandrosta-1,3,5(10)-triene-9,17-dione monooxygenase reductase component